MADRDELGLRLPIRGVQLIEASAGTGKTFTVATVYARLVIELALPVSRLLAVTFTEAATRDLREQLRKRLERACALLDGADADVALADVDGERPEDRISRQLLRAALARESRLQLRARLRRAVEQMDLAPIHTIHAFCQRALHEHALEAGQPLEARELLANESTLRHEVALEFWRRHSLHAGEAAALRDIWSSPAELAGSLRELLALDALAPAVEVARGATDDGDRVEGEGYGDGDNDDDVNGQGADGALRAARADLASAFAAHGDHARELLRSACAAGVLHAAYSKDAAVDPVWAALRQWLPAPLDSDPATDKLDNYASSHLRQRTNKPKRNGAAPATPESPLFDAIERWALARAAADAVLERRKLALVHAARAFALGRIAALKHARRQIGFDDMITGVADALADDRDGGFARALQAQYAVALVDEFQDTDPRQWAIFKRLFAAPDDDGDDAPRALILIGDPKQAIYRFRGGDVATYLVAQQEAEARYPLQFNFRSRPLALDAVQALFELGGDGAFDQPGIDFEPVQAGGACADDAFELDGRPAPGLVLQQIAADDDAGDAVEALREQATAACAIAIHRLLDRAARGQATLVDRKGERRPIAPGDLSVLVARNEDATRIQRALSTLGVPSVAAGRCSLYQTEEALHLCWLLEALLAPADDGRLRAVLASPLFGLDALAIAALDQDLVEHRRWQDRLRGWQQRAQKHGPMALLGDLCAEQAPRLLGWPDGERRLGNYLQLAEEMQAADRGALGLAGLLSELARRIEDADAENDAELLRLESDAARVRIMTLHVSKGLTLDLVFIPYAATTSTTPRPNTPPMAKSHDGLARVGWLFPGRKDPVCLEEARESRAEHVRLLYVGLTRARLATWVGWGATKGAHKTALGWLLHRTPSASDVPAISADQATERLHALRALAPEAIAIVEPIASDAFAALPRLRFDDGQAPPPARIAQRHLDRDWWVYSFSQLAREDSGSDARGADDEPEAAPLERNRFSGSRFGNALHDTLERVDFAAWRDWSGELPPTGQLAPLVEGLRRNGYQNEADQFEGLPVLTALVAETLNAPMPEGTRLAWLPAEAMRAEMEFHLALAPVQVTAMLDLLHAHGLVAARRAFGLRQRLEGLLTGRIDLIYRADERFYVLDYKSNQLPDYGPQAVAQAIADGEYDLQYLIYTLALHRWLRFRLGAGYDVERHLGGVRYLFCRGLDRDDPARPGVHALRLPSELVLALDALLAPAAVPA